MVLVSVREAEIVRRVSQHKQEVTAQQRVLQQRAAAFRQARSGGDAAAERHADQYDPQWQREAAALQSSTMSLAHDVERLRMSDRRAWRKDEQTLIREIFAADEEWRRELMKERTEEATDRRKWAMSAPNIQFMLHRREAEWEHGRKSELARARAAEPRPWATASATTAELGPSGSEGGRPSTAPAARRRPRTAPSKRHEHVRGRTPPARNLDELMVVGTHHQGSRRDGTDDAAAIFVTQFSPGYAPPAMAATGALGAHFAPGMRKRPSTAPKPMRI